MPHPLIDHILDSHRDTLGGDFPGYRNHVYRMVNFCLVLGDFDEVDRAKIAIAGSFHDLGIWTADTFDYLPPSIALAAEYLNSHGRDHWTDEITEMICLHHRVRKTSKPLTEAFRRADLADFSLGIVKGGVPPDFIRAVKAEFPNNGFHKQLLRRGFRWFCRHPLNPVPVLKW
jgi:hypothetical protein